MIYSLAHGLIRLLVGLFLRFEVEGREHIPRGGYLVVCNHLSWSDTLFIALALPKYPIVHTMANRSTVFNRRFKRWLLPKLGVFPIERGRKGMLDESAVNAVYEMLEKDEPVLIFPEGAYGKDGQLKRLKDGIGYFALNSGRPLLPVSISGSDRLRPFGRVRVVIGEPFIPDPPLLPEIRLRVQAVVDAVGDRLRHLGSRSAKGRRSASDVPQAPQVEAGNPEVDEEGPAAGDDQA